MPDRAVFQFPEVGEAKSNVVADRPIVILAFYWNRERAALRMALNAGVGGGNRIHLRRINDVIASGMCSVFCAGAVTTFAAYVPFGDLLAMNVIAHGVTSIAGWTGWALHVVVGIVLRPPVGAGRRHFVRFPLPGSDNPLRRQWKVIVTDFGEVALLPDATVNEGDLIFAELRNFIGSQVGKDGVRMFVRITDDICHRGFLPALVDIGMAFRASLRANIVRGLRCLCLRWRRAKATDKGNKFPAVSGGFPVDCWHTSELNAVLDDVMNFAVGEVLGRRGGAFG